jgi:hypothetical protein
MPVVLPALGVVLLIALAARIVRARTFSSPSIVPLLLALAAGATIWWMPPDFPYPYPASIERTRPHVRVRPPMDITMRVLWGGNDIEHNYHVTLPSNRWAYDLGVDPVPDEFGVPTPSLEDFGCWGLPVLAPVSGRVASVRDSVPDALPGTRWKLGSDNRGNYVSIRIETGTYVVLSHLQRGSIRVLPGDHVLEGAPIAACGNSGQSTLPHIHLDHLREPPELYLAGMDFSLALPIFFRDHGGRPIPLGGGRTRPDGLWEWTGDTIRYARSR